MASKYVLDAHALIWYLEGNPRLGAGAKAVMDDPANEMVAPIIALCEAVHVIGKGRTKIKTADEFLDQIERDPRLEIAGLTADILKTSLPLLISEMHDRLIVATALHEKSLGHNVSLLTCDANIIGSGLVHTVW
ncbi:MAG: type II toxin-antitoxin system VapC family toxin [Pyrinomonadaceae bacterium]